MKNKIAVLFIAKNNGVSIRYTIESCISTIKYWDKNCQIDFYSYINDCSDNTEEEINKAFISADELVSLTLENSVEKTVSYPSIVKEDRIISLAKCRNKCVSLLLKSGNFEDYNAVIWIDSDYLFEIEVAKKTIPFVIENKMDACSAYSLHADMPELLKTKELYDKWGTRESDFECWWACKPYEDLPELIKTSCTYNGFCVYKPEFFTDENVFSKEGFASAMSVNGFDVDLASVFIKGRKKGLNRVFMNKTAHSLWFKVPGNLKEGFKQ